VAKLDPEPSWQVLGAAQPVGRLDHWQAGGGRAMFEKSSGKLQRDPIALDQDPISDSDGPHGLGFIETERGQPLVVAVVRS